MAHDLFVMFRFPDSVVNLETKKLLMSGGFTFARTGFVLDEETNERVVYFEFLTRESKAEYIAALQPEFAKHLVKDEPMEQWVGPE